MGKGVELSLLSHQGVRLPRFDPSEMPNSFHGGCSAFLKSETQPRWLLCSKTQSRVPRKANCLSLKALDNWLQAKWQGLGLPFSCPS